MVAQERKQTATFMMGAINLSVLLESTLLSWCCVKMSIMSDSHDPWLILGFHLVSAKFPEYTPITLFISKRADDQRIFLGLAVTKYFSSSKAVTYGKCVGLDLVNPFLVGLLRTGLKKVSLAVLLYVWKCFTNNMCVPRAPYNCLSWMRPMVVLVIRVITDIS